MKTQVWMAGLVSFLCLSPQFGLAKSQVKQVKPKVTASTRASLADLYPWFDSLDFDAVRTGQFVKVKREGKPEQAEYGFVSSSPGSTETVLTINLTHLERGTGPRGFLSFETANLEAFARARLQIDKLAPDLGNRRASINRIIHGFVLARACEFRGIRGVASSYLDFLPTALAESSWPDGKAETNLRPAVKVAIAFSQVDEADRSEYGRGETWATLLSAYRRVLRLYVFGREEARLKEGVAFLSAIVDQERAGTADLPEAERLVLALVNERPPPSGWFGSAIFDRMRGSQGDTPAHALLRMEYKAVPALITALADRRPTQCSCANRFLYTESFLTVGDIALQILREISARSFGEILQPISEQSARECQGHVSEWWKRAQTLGEFGDLKVGVETEFGRDCATVVERLEERYPAVASQIISDVLPRRKGALERSLLVSALDSHLDPTAISIAKREAVAGPNSLSRIAAAKTLRNIDPDFATRVLVREWKGFSNWNTRQPNGFREPFLSPEAQNLIEGMVSIGTPAALDALAQSLKGRPLDVRKGVVVQLVEVEPSSHGRRYAASYENLLASELGDCEKVEAEGAESYGPEYLVAPELGDVAASILSRTFPAKYRFKTNKFRYLMKRQRDQFMNVWRASRGLPPVALATPPKSIPESSRNLVTRVVVLSDSPEIAMPVKLARKLQGKRLDWSDVQALLAATTSVPVGRGRCVQITFSRDAPNEGLVVTVGIKAAEGFTFYDERGGYLLNVIFDGVLIDDRADAISHAFAKNRIHVEWCLNSKPSVPFEIEYRVWPQIMGTDGRANGKATGGNR